jgi:hypothetical protein
MVNATWTGLLKPDTYRSRCPIECRSPRRIRSAVRHINRAVVRSKGGAEGAGSNRNGRSYFIGGDRDHRDVVASRVLDICRCAVRTHRYPTRPGTYRDGLNHCGVTCHGDDRNRVGCGVSNVGERPVRRGRHRHAHRAVLYLDRGDHRLRGRVDHRNRIGRSVHYVDLSSVGSESHAQWAMIGLEWWPLRCRSQH